MGGSALKTIKPVLTFCTIITSTEQKDLSPVTSEHYSFLLFSICSELFNIRSTW